MQWTKADARKARKEGWDYSHGYLRIITQPDGFYRISSIHALLKSILDKAQRGSSWHENIFMSLPWTEADNMIANKIGFVISQNRFFFPDAKFFDMEDITARANDGCLICRKALATLTRRKLLHGQRQNH